MKVFVMLPIENAVAGTTGALVARFARPLTPVHVVPSGQMIVTETPGAWYFTRSASS